MTSMRQVKASIDRFEGDRVVLSADDRAEFVIPRSALPHDMREGARVILTISSENEETDEKENLAKKILNEILKKKS